MTGKEVETVATLLKRVRERADLVEKAVTRTAGTYCVGCGHNYERRGTDPCPKCGDLRSCTSSVSEPGYAIDIAEGMKSLAAAVEMVTIELAEVRARLDANTAPATDLRGGFIGPDGQWRPR